MQEEIINTSFTTLPLKDEVFKINVLSPKMHLSHKDILEEDDDIVKTFLDVTIPSIHGTSPREEVLMDISNPAPQFCPTHRDTLEQEDGIISNALDALSSKDVSLENKEINQVNTIHVSSYEKPKPKIPRNILKVTKYICERGDI